MCGIAGFIGVRPLSSERERACLDVMGHRGPDAHGVYRHSVDDERHVCLLHSRLNIIDLEARANQPFIAGQYVLAYNGEIYNYVELRAQLTKEGEIFSTQSDTEVLLLSLKRWGLDALQWCEGMWGFALYDESDGSLVLSRDRFGEKPLYFHKCEEGLYFGSEVKFIFAMMGRKLAPDINHLHRYMINGYRFLYKQAVTFFAGLEEIPRASVMRFTRDGAVENRYWSQNFSPDETMSYGEAVERTRQAMIEAVRIRLRADVPLAFCMSGGIDSNSLISIAKNVFDYDVHGFTIVNTDERYEEQGIVTAAVGEQGLRHTSVQVTADRFLDRLRTLVRAHDAPVLTITYYAQWLLLEAMHEASYKISISGTGADELFSGYYDHHLFYLAAVHGDPTRFKQAREEWERYIKPIVRNPFLQDALAFVDNPEQREHLYLGADEFSKWFVSDWNEPFFEARYCDDIMRNRMLNELFHEIVPPILHEDDLNAMYFSIENRSPFLDRNLSELAYSIPTRHLVQRGAAKSILRDAMRGIVPDVVLDSRRKVGFNAPINSFLDVSDPAVRSEVLRDSPIFDYIRRERIDALMQKGVLPNSESKFLFYFLNTKIFLEEFAQ